MKKKTILILLIGLLLTSCYVYQKPKVYSKDYKFSANNDVNLDGYYDKDSIGNNMQSSYYFYNDGTVINIDKGTVQRVNIEKEIQQYPQYGNYGIYTMKGDTIFTEFWQATSFAPIIKKHRINQKIIARGDSIIFLEAKFGHNPKIVFDPPRVSYFVESDIKPDPSFNWIKKKKKWNKNK